MYDWAGSGRWKVMGKIDFVLNLLAGYLYIVTMMAKIIERRILILRIVVCLFFVLGVSLSFKVWHSDRIFPLLPVFDWIPSSSIDFSKFLAMILSFGLLIGAFVRSRSYFIGFFALLLSLLLQDQMRWQPWVYIYVAFLVTFALWKRTDERLLPYFQFLLIGVYLWSGAYKFGGSFIELTWDKMLRTILFIDDPSTRQSLHFLGYGIPIIEILIAAGLFFKKSRHLAILFAIATHVVILIYVITNQQNSVIYPWNFAMIFLVILCFYKTENSMSLWTSSLSRSQELSKKLKLQIASGALFFVLLPALNPLGLWDNYLSFKLYSGTNGAFCVGLDKDQYKKVDPALYDYFWVVEKPNGKYWIYVNLWALDELNVAFYPEEPTFRELARSFCDGAIPEEKLEFVIFKDGFKRKGAKVLNCANCQ